MSLVACLIFVLCAHYSLAAYSWSNCLANKHDIDVLTVEVSPDPVSLPGDVHLKINGHTNRNISSSNLNLQIKRKTFLGEITIPCIDHVGSCVYNDICTLISRMETENWGGLSTGLGTDIKTMLSAAGVDSSVCPLPPTSLIVEDGVLHMPKPPALLSAFTSGDYHFHATVTEAASNEMIFCLDLYLTVTEPCSGIFCAIG